MLVYVKNMAIMLRVTQNHCFNVYTQKLFINCLDSDIETVMRY